MTEREMQEIFYEYIKKFNKRNLTFNWFQEVGNHDSFFRADIISYDKKNIECYELKLKSCKSLLNQIQKHEFAKRFTRIYAVLPKDEAEKFKVLSTGKNNNIYIISFDPFSKEIKIIKRGKNLEQRVSEKINLMDLIIRGFHLDGFNKRKGYK